MTTENTVTVNPSHGQRPKVVVITGPTGSGKSKLAVDLASHFPIEVINADSMQVYSGLDILTNKIPFSEQNGVPHHLLGTVNPNFEFTAKAFRDSAIPIIDAILRRNNIPVIVGGTNYYIQALVSSFLLDDSTDDLNESYFGDSPGITGYDNDLCSENDSSSNSYDFLKDIDPVAANRIHPNNHRKINQYISLYSRTGVLPSKVFQGQAAEKWGQADNLRYDCCFISVDASLPVLDRYVEQRVDDMMDAGLLNEVYNIYTMNADYTRGLRQAIGVREFENLLRTSVFKSINKKEVELIDRSNLENTEPLFHGNLMEWLRSSSDTKSTTLLEEAIEKVKVNTRRLVRRQKRMLSRLQTLFGWDIHYVDSTESISSRSNDVWISQVVEPVTKIVTSFLSENGSLSASNGNGTKIIQRDLWTQYTCKACNDRVLRGLHEWEQHIRGRGHRKRISSLKSKAKGFSFVEHKHESSERECSDML
ncbi:adenylate isopentenyltransferase 3, chloroplastic [Trifolium repens]|nr:adenylate isopentenyltransferase 3, chloroplastic [Trifolium repens]